jgi:hypothetical protein
MDHTSEHDVEAPWSAEIKRRLVEIDAGSVVPSCVFGVRNLRGMGKGEQDARRGSVFDL